MDKQVEEIIGDESTNDVPIENDTTKRISIKDRIEGIKSKLEENEKSDKSEIKRVKEITL